MKNGKIVKIEGDFDAEALGILRDIPGITVEEDQPRQGGRRPDAVLRFPGSADPVVVEMKRQANAATAWQLVQQADAAPQERLILIAGTSTAEAREILERHGIAFVDGLGNAHIELPGLLLHLDGRRRRPRARVSARLSGKAGVAAQALLLQPHRAWKVKDLAAEAHVSVGLAHRVLARLEDEALITVEGAGPKRARYVANPTALLDLWAEENQDRAVQRVRGYRLAREPRNLADEVSARLEIAGIQYAVTGAAAAARVAPFITAVPVSDIWVSALTSQEDFVAAADVEIVDTGQNLVLAQAKKNEPLAFRRQVEGIWMVNLFRLFYDLRNDPRRGREQADRLRQEVIGF